MPSHTPKEMQHKIVVTSPMSLSAGQIERLKKSGELKVYDTLPSDAAEWLMRCQGFDIICSGKYGLQEKIYENKGVFYSLPFVAVGWIDKERLKKNNITVSYCPGCNKNAVSEWIIGMMLLLLRKFDKLACTPHLQDKTGSPEYLGLAYKKACVLGAGNVGSLVGKICRSFEMEVTHFKRGDNLTEKIKEADIVINCLNSNPTTENLLGAEFFKSLKKGSYFITVTSRNIYDPDVMLKALEEGIIAGVADDCGSIMPGDYEDSYYKKLCGYKNVLATPHISYQSDVTIKKANDMMIDNVEAWIKGAPVNLLV